jgi:hypothetical protein
LPGKSRIIEELVKITAAIPLGKEWRQLYFYNITLYSSLNGTAK